jgi:integrase
LSVFPTIALLPASEVTSYHIAEMVRRVFESGKERQAGALRSYLSAAFTAARKSPFDPTLPSDFIPFEIESNPVDPVPAIPSKAGDRVLSVDELTGYVRKLDGSNLTSVALRLALYAGGQRIAQLIRAEVTDYNPVTQTLKLLDSKGKRKEPRVHLLPLGPVAASIVSELVEQAKKHGERSLFVSQGVRLHPHTPGKLVKKIAHGLGGESFDLRDMRRTCETVMVGQLKITSSVLAQVLSHGITGVQAKHYDKYTYTDEKRAALMQWERYLDRLVTGEEEQKIVPIRQGRAQA